MHRLDLLCATLVPFTLAGQVDVLTSNYNNERTSANLSETVLTAKNVNKREFGKLGAFPVDGQIYAQPLYVHRVDFPERGTRSAVFVATMHNSVYAFDADSPQSPAPLWTVNLGTPVPVSLLRFRDIDDEVGILSTPVIDLASNTIYVVAETLDNELPVFHIHALDLSDGHEKSGGPIVIAPSVNGVGDGSQTGHIVMNPMRHLQRPGLLLLNGAVYVAFGSIRDHFPFHGWIAAYDAANLHRQVAIFNTTPDGGAGGIWQSGRGLAADADGNIYAATGNGDCDGQRNFGEAFIKLSPFLSVVDWYAPPDWHEMSDVDSDLGSLGPVLVPGTHLLIGGDKAHNMYLVQSNSMGHFGLKGIADPQIFQPVESAIFNIALWNRTAGPLAYVVESGDFTAAYRIRDGRFETQPFSKTSVTSDYPFQGMAISANGSMGSSGILWLTAGDHTKTDIPGTLYAFDAMHLNKLLWSSKAPGDQLGKFAKFATPTVANGRVFVPTFSNELAVYGLKPPSN